jgi:hypothetical protein
MNWQRVTGTVVRGHRVASGLNGDARFPGGTLAMQRPHFAALGLDLGGLHDGTLNVSIAPLRVELRRPRHTFPHLKWHPTEPAETFSFVQARLETPAGETVEGWIYVPHTETKPEHFQAPGVVELWMPFVPGVDYGREVAVWAPEEEVLFVEAGRTG